MAHKQSVIFQSISKHNCHLNNPDPVGDRWLSSLLQVKNNNLVGLQHIQFSCFSVLMTVLFGSYATASSRAPPHAHEDTEESMNRLFENETANVQDHIGDKLVSYNFLLSQEKIMYLELVYCNVHND